MKVSVQLMVLEFSPTAQGKKPLRESLSAVVRAERWGSEARGVTSAATVGLLKAAICLRLPSKDPDSL